MDTELVPHEATAGAEPSEVQQQHLLSRPSISKSRSLSDSGGTLPRLFPSPHTVESARWTSKDDYHLHIAGSASSTATAGAIATLPALPSTPKRSEARGLSLQVQHQHQHQYHQQQLPLSSRISRDFTPPPPVVATASGASGKPAPLSPKLDHSHIYASPTNILPRRSRGLEFSRAATSLHHSTLAESSPESSPTVGGRGMSFSAHRSDYPLGGAGAGPGTNGLQASALVWPPAPGLHEKTTISSSMGSTQAIGSDSSSSSEDEDWMDEDMDEPIITTPRVSRADPVGTGSLFGSPAMGTLASFQNRQRQRRHHKKKVRGPLGLGFNVTASSLSRSPPSNSARARRESISWQANQLHISSADGEDNVKSPCDGDGPSSDGQPSVIRRAVTRRGNLLPKTKTFARIRAALMEEGAPAEAEFRREAEVVKQVRESDIDQESRPQVNTLDLSQAVSALSSPSMMNQDSIDEHDEDLMCDSSSGLPSSFKQHLRRNRSRSIWDTFSECSSNGGGARASPPPQQFMPHGSSSGISDDNALDSPLFGPLSYAQSHGGGTIGPLPPSAAEISRRIHSKRRRDDDFDPMSIKRRAVSPGMSVHNSPVVQSPMQRDNIPWGSRPGSTGGDRAGSSAQSDSGSMGGAAAGTPSGRLNSNKGRVGFQGMVDANDAIMRMSIE